MLDAMCARTGDESSGSEGRIVVLGSGIVGVMMVDTVDDDEGIDMECTVVVVVGGLGAKAEVSFKFILVTV